MFLPYLVFGVFAVGGVAWGVFWTSVTTRRAATRVLEGASKTDRRVLFWWRFLAPWTAFAGFVALMAANTPSGLASAAVLLSLVACIIFVRPIRAFTVVWARTLCEPWDRP